MRMLDNLIIRTIPSELCDNKKKQKKNYQQNSPQKDIILSFYI